MTTKYKFKLGDVIGHNTIIENYHNGQFLCKCDCGSSPRKLWGHTILEKRRCKKCYSNYMTGENNPAFNGYKGLYGNWVNFLNRFNKRRGFNRTNITNKFLWELFLNQNKKCALSGLPIKMKIIDSSKYDGVYRTASLDRIDSSCGYFKNNIQWVHKDVNLMKRDLTQTDFIRFCKTVVDYSYLKHVSDNDDWID